MGKYYVILTNNETGKKESLNYFGYRTKKEATAIMCRANMIGQGAITATVEKKK